ncbi:MAG TPA: OmpA family protein, partial [Gemmatimonadales bacterium]
DGDADNVPDGVDRCPNTPAGAAVDARGCPQDADEDGVSDGLDRCPDTPKGASVDQLGCPGDEDGDRVLDGLDRCPRTPAGAAVNAFGCPPGVPEGTSGTSFAPGSRRILPISFARLSARLPDAARPLLDSLATALAGQPNVSVEIAAHGDGTAQETRHLTQLRADAVRNYLVSKGASVQRVTARGYGSDQRLTGGTSAEARDRNRRIELRVLAAAPGR